MNPLKSQLKILVGNTLGSHIEDLAESYEAEQHRCEGGVATSKQAMEAVRALLLHVNRDLEDEKLTEESAELLRAWLQKAIEAVNAVGTQKEAMKLVALGSVNGVRNVVDWLKKEMDKEQTKIDKGEGPRAHLETPAVTDLATRKKRPARKTRKKATA